MKLLAIDTSSDACSVALQYGDNVVENHIVAPREHTKILLPMIREILADADIRPEELDAVVLGNGPGSFIGMRIGASVAQGLAYAAGLQIVPVSSLAAIAREVITGKPGANVIVAQDARMHEVYVGCYGANNAGELQLLGEECIRAVERLDRVPAPAVAAGAAWQAYPQLLAANEDQIEEVSGVRVPRAAYLLAAGIEGLNAGRAILPEALVPAYLRATVAAKRPVVS